MVRSDIRAFELGDGTEDLKERPAHSGGGADAVTEHDEVDLFDLSLLRRLDEVLQRSAESIELGD